MFTLVFAFLVYKDKVESEVLFFASICDFILLGITLTALGYLR